MKNFLTLISLSLLSIFISEQVHGQRKSFNVPPQVCYASGKVERAAIPPSPEIMDALKSATVNKSDIVVTYSSNFPEEAKQAFEYAVSIWETIIESTVPIYVDATWKSLGETTLGSCSPNQDYFYANFENAPHPNIYYPVALAEKLSKTEITGKNVPDIYANFNSDADWYFSTDMNTPDSQYDFTTVVMHEMAHGLGFFGFFFVDGTIGNYGYYDYGDASTFDLLVIKNNGDRLLDTTLFPNQSTALKNALTSNALYNSSPTAKTDGGGYKPTLYAPSTWDDGSSVYHLNENTYPSSNANSLMTPFIGKAEAIHNPGPISAGIMADIGWKHLYINFDKLKDIEAVKPLAFNVYLNSEFELDSSSLFVVYSTDNFQNEIDSIPLLADTTETLFKTELVPPIETGSIQYYISAGDVKNRTFRLPAEAPKDLYTITIGPDTEKPVITHNPIPFFLLTGDSLEITANIDDNLGIDTVFVQYTINDVSQTPFALKNKTGTIYSGLFSFDPAQLNDGDIITYNITAKDASVSNNKTVIPYKFNYSFKAEQVYDPVEKYIHMFDFSTTDFVLTDFDIYTPTGFTDGGLQSPHPYPSPDASGEEYNFSTILKHPVILKENGTMTFDEVVLVEPSESYADFGDSEFWDYVIVEGSKDNGKTWLQLINGYDSRANANWLSAYNLSLVNQVSGAIGSSDMFKTREINLTENGNFSAGDTILFRFRLYSDPFAHGWGWAIDNLRIQVAVSSELTALSSEKIGAYPNPFTNQLQIQIETTKPVSEIQADIFNIYGQKVKTFRFENITGNINESVSLGDLSDGIYLLTFKENGKNISSQKIIKTSK